MSASIGVENLFDIAIDILPKSVGYLAIVCGRSHAWGGEDSQWEGRRWSQTAN